MKPRLNTTSLLAAMLFSCYAASGQTSATMPNSTPNVVLDQDRVQASDDTIKLAAERGDLDTLMLALHKGIRTEYCFDQIRTLPRPKLVQVLIRMLEDEQVLPPAPHEGYFPLTKSISFDYLLPRLVEKLCYVRLPG